MTLIPVSKLSDKRLEKRLHRLMKKSDKLTAAKKAINVEQTKRANRE